ncbi:hypothetical protein ACFV2Z_22740 [Streptomyces sp. NPDC059688]|uniref:Uncharacterized protein n=1 Tax=Streptomyces albidocamelliae TaxID=2981135 RepID=A0ABY6F182_9ACTN|nr:hypothetical protein [Streptomyces sp. HUAS 14-6]UXY40414.1 hypothetical protein N8I86_38260 [Streptomyces sp. HUAS 14-6]
MRSGSPWQRVSTAAVAGAAAVAILAPAASAAPAVNGTPHAHASQAGTALPRQLTQDAYVAWLKKQHTDAAAATLKAFTKLSNLRKYIFLQQLQNRSAYAALQAQLKGGPKGFHKTVPYNKVISIARDVAITKTRGKKPATTVTFTVTQTIYNIPVTSHTVWATYQTAKGKQLKVTDSGARVTNTNGAYAIKATSSGSTHTGATAQWHGAPRVASVGKAIDKQQSVATSASVSWKAGLTTN